MSLHLLDFRNGADTDFKEPLESLFISAKASQKKRKFTGKFTTYIAKALRNTNLTLEVLKIKFQILSAFFFFFFRRQRFIFCRQIYVCGIQICLRNLLAGKYTNMVLS